MQKQKTIQSSLLQHAHVLPEENNAPFSHHFPFKIKQAIKKIHLHPKYSHMQQHEKSLQLSSKIDQSLKHEQKSQGNQKMIKCEICENMMNVFDMISLSKCQHTFCKNCLSAYFIYKINSMEDISCPDQNCGCVYNDENLILNSIPQKIQARFQKYLIWRQNIENIEIKICPEEDCIEGTINMTINPLSCSSCGLHFCSECLMKQHQGNCADNFQKTYELIKRCPRCKIMIEKNQGCDHMVCKCGYQFGFITLRKWEDIMLLRGGSPFENWSLHKKRIIGGLLLFALPLFLSLLIAIYVIGLAVCLPLSFIGSFTVLPYKAVTSASLNKWQICVYFIFFPITFPISAVFLLFTMEWWLFRKFIYFSSFRIRRYWLWLKLLLCESQNQL